MDTSKLVVGQKIWLRCGGLLGEPTEPTEATVRKINDWGITLEVHLPPDSLNPRPWGVVFKNGEQCGGIWVFGADGEVNCEWDRRFKAVFEEGEHTKPHRFTKDTEI